MKINSDKLQLLSTIFQGIIALGIIAVALREFGLSGSVGETLIFNLSVIFQFSGAVILLIGTFGKSGGHVAEEAFKKLSIFKVSIEADVMASVAKSVHLSRAAFVYLAIGYLLSIFGSRDYGNIWITLLCVLAGSAILIALTCLLVKVQTKKPETITVEEDPQHMP